MLELKVCAWHRGIMEVQVCKYGDINATNLPAIAAKLKNYFVKFVDGNACQIKLEFRVEH